MSLSGKFSGLLLAIFGAYVPGAWAQFAVIDVASVTQLMSEVQTLEQQLATAKADLAQAQQAYWASVGGRGMESLLAGTNRNYLPTSWSGLSGAFQGSGTYPALATDLSTALSGNAVLTAQQTARLSPAANQQLLVDRQTVALLQAVSHEALSTTSIRFASLQQLIDAIQRAGDQKAALDLNARIAAESSMLQNEQAKLQVLYQGIQAQRWANEQRAREQIVAGHGDFASRFQPRP